LRCGLASEDKRSTYELRQLLFGRRRTYRAIFTVVSSRVVVLTIRHASQDEWNPGDFDID